MRNFDRCRSSDVSDGPCYSQYPIVDARREVKSFCRSYGDLACFIRYFGEVVDIDIRHFCISVELGSREPLFLGESSNIDHMDDLFGRELWLFLFEFTHFHSRDLDEYIHPVEDWTRESWAISFDRTRATATSFFRISHVSTRTGIHRSYQRESAWIARAHIDTTDRDLAIFEWLSEGFEERFIEFEKFIKKEYSLMCEWYLSWSCISSSSDDRCFTRCMVDDTKWSLSDHGDIFREESCDRIYLRELDLLFCFHSREYPSKCFCEHSLPTSRRSLHEDVMSSCCRDDERSFCLFLTMDRREIDRHRRSGKGRYIEFSTFFERFHIREHIDHFFEIFYGYDIDIWYDGCLGHIRFREEYILVSEFTREYRRWKSSLDGSHHPIECEFSEKERRSCDLFIEVIFFPKDSESDRKIIDRSFFFEVCWSEVHCNTGSSRKRKSRIFQSTSYSFSTFLDGHIAESYDREIPHSSYHIDLHFYQISADTSKRRREKLLHRENLANSRVFLYDKVYIKIIYFFSVLANFSREDAYWVLNYFIYKTFFILSTTFILSVKKKNVRMFARMKEFCYYTKDITKLCTTCLLYGVYFSSVSDSFSRLSFRYERYKYIRLLHKKRRLRVWSDFSMVLLLSWRILSKL